jgi:hypothetical protein
MGALMLSFKNQVVKLVTLSKRTLEGVTSEPLDWVALPVTMAAKVVG